MNKSVLRGILFVVILGLVLTIPWWLSAIILVGLTIYFDLYLEVLFFGFLIDVLYSAKLAFPYIALGSAFALILLVSFAKTQIRT